MPRDRRKQYQRLLERERLLKQEKALDPQNAYGDRDETPRLAVNGIINGKQRG